MKNENMETNNFFGGTYSLASETVNERPYWILEDEDLSLLYDGNNWIIGDITKKTKTGSTHSVSTQGNL